MTKFFAWGAALVLVLVLAASWIIFQVDARTVAETQYQGVSAAEHSINTRFFTTHRTELEWFSKQPEVIQFMTNGGSPSTELNRLLRAVQGVLAIESVSLVSTKGVIVAASRNDYCGISLEKTKIFAEGISGDPLYNLAFEPHSKRRGIYASVPIWNNNNVEGVAIFRTDAVQLDRTFDHFPYTFLLDSKDQMFSYSPQLKDFSTSRWTWDGPLRAQVQGVWYRVSRFPLDAVPGFTVVSLEPETWPWQQLLIVNLLLCLAVASALLLWQQLRLSQERRTEAATRKQQETLLANLLEGIAVLDSSGKLIWANPAFERLAEMKPGDPAPTMGDLWDRPAGGPWQEVLAGQSGEVVFESVLRGRQGGWTPVVAGFTKAGDRFLLSALDRSERHRSDQLLRQSQKLTVLGQLAGGVAHDLNNMLGVLMGMTDLLKMTLPEQDPLQESVDLMLTTLARAASLSDKMLNFARQTPLTKVSLDVTALLRELRFLARTALPEMIDAVVEVAPGPIHILGDENLLLSAMLNLILNAGEAMEGGGTVLVRGFSQVPEKFTIAVEDHSRGMDRETLSHIFEPFFSTKHEKKGTGLGLSLVRRTILEHDGSIQVESTPGKGTLVTVVLPVVS